MRRAGCYLPPACYFFRTVMELCMCDDVHRRNYKTPTPGRTYYDHVDEKAPSKTTWEMVRFVRVLVCMLCPTCMVADHELYHPRGESARFAMKANCAAES